MQRLIRLTLIVRGQLSFSILGMRRASRPFNRRLTLRPLSPDLEDNNEDCVKQEHHCSNDAVRNLRFARRLIGLKRAERCETDT